MECTVCHRAPATHIAFYDNVFKPYWESTRPLIPRHAAEFCEVCAQAVAQQRNDKAIPPQEPAAKKEKSKGKSNA